MEKYLQKAIEDNNCKNGGIAVAMNPSNGDILGMATYPDYDLNNPFEIELSEGEDTTDALNTIWRNFIQIL